jgi:hypothetical protein
MVPATFYIRYPDLHRIRGTRGTVLQIFCVVVRLLPRYACATGRHLREMASDGLVLGVVIAFLSQISQVRQRDPLSL